MREEERLLVPLEGEAAWLSVPRKRRGPGEKALGGGGAGRAEHAVPPIREEVLPGQEDP